MPVQPPAPYDLPNSVQDALNALRVALDEHGDIWAGDHAGISFENVRLIDSLSINIPITTKKKPAQPAPEPVRARPLPPRMAHTRW